MQFIWAAIRGYLRMPFEMVQWSSQCDQDNLSPALPLSQCNYLLHHPVCASSSKGYWLGSYDGRGRTELVAPKICHHFGIGLRARRSRLCLFLTMEDMGHRNSGLLDVISGSPPNGDRLTTENGQLKVTLHSFLLFLDIDID